MTAVFKKEFEFRRHPITCVFGKCFLHSPSLQNFVFVIITGILDQGCAVFCMVNATSKLSAISYIRIFIEEEAQSIRPCLAYTKDHYQKNEGSVEIKQRPIKMGGRSR
jgi:hypothetical protein